MSRSLKNLLAPLALAVLLLGAIPAAADWSVDNAHTEINFSIKHFFTPTSGTFRVFDVDLNYDAASPANSSVSATVDIASVDTRNESRDGHLKSGDWFEADKHPKMKFTSSSVKQVSDTQLVAKGILEIKGKEMEIEMPIEILGFQDVPAEMQEMFGGAQQVGSFRATATVDRNDFGVGVGNWAATAVVGGEVTIEILLEAHRK